MGTNIEKTVLIVEDDILSQKIIEYIATSLNFKVLITDCAKSLFQRVDIKPDIILADLHLPDMSVEELLLQLKETCEKHKDQFRVILMTGSLTDDIKNICKKYGFTNIIEKPITKNLLKGALKQEAEQDDSIIDLSFYLKGVGDNPKVLKVSLENVEKSWGHYIEEMEKAITSNDDKALHYWAHTLKGSLSFIKAEDGVSLSKEICEAAMAKEVAKTTEPTKKLKEYLKTIHNEIEKIKNKINY